MVVFSNKAAILGLALSAATTSTTTAFQPPSSFFTNTAYSKSKSSSSSTSLNNILRDYADYSPSRGPYSDSGTQSSNWRKNQGYTSSTTPRLFGGSYRDAETNPYYDPGWAQSTRRDNPAANYNSGSNYNGYDDPYNWRENRGYWNSVTYPGVGDSYRSNKVYTNPTNPYYDPIWSQSYDVSNEDRRPIREEEHMMYYGPGYDRDSYYPDYGFGGGYYGRRGGGRGGGGGMMRGEYEGGYRGGRGDAFGGYGRMNGPGRGLLATATSLKDERRGMSTTTNIHNRKWMEARTAGYKGINGNSLMRIGRNTESNSMSRKNDNNNFALRMSYPIYDEFDGPFLPPPGMGGPGMMGGPGARMMEGRWGPDMRRRGRGGQGGGPRRGPGPMGPDGMGMGRDGMGMGDMGRGMGGGPSMGGWGPGGGGPGGPQFGRDKAVGRMSLKDMAARTTQSYDAEVISSMNNRNKNNNNQLRGDSMGPVMGQQQRAGGGPASNPTSTANQYVPLSSTYGPQATERSPPLTVGAPPPPPPIIETRASPDLSSETSSSSSSTPSTVQTARSVRPSVVLVTSTGVRNENSQGSGFVVEFDDAADESDIEEVDRCYILTSAHVAPPGWKVSVTFPSDPDKQYPATVVGRKLNSDLALLAVESAIDDNDEDPFPPPLIMSSEDILTDTKSSSSSSSSITSNEIGSPLYAFGYPMGLEGPTMTSGILSATTKGINYMDAPTGEEPSEISKSRPFEKTNFVITDAAMAGGMSGGPLVNSEGVVLGVNALVRPDLRALGNYAVSSIECESFLEKLEDQRDVAKQASKKVDARSERRKKRKEARKSEDSTTSSSDSSSDDDEVPADGVAGYRVMLYGYSTSKAEATTILRRAAGLDELRAENAMRSAYSFGAGVVDEFYVSEAGDRKRAEKAARKKADDLFEKLKEEGMMVEVEPLTLLP